MLHQPCVAHQLQHTALMLKSSAGAKRQRTPSPTCHHCLHVMGGAGPACHSVHASTPAIFPQPPRVPISPALHPSPPPQQPPQTPLPTPALPLPATTACMCEGCRACSLVSMAASLPGRPAGSCSSRRGWRLTMSITSQPAAAPHHACRLRCFTFNKVE